MVKFNTTDGFPGSSVSTGVIAWVLMAADIGVTDTKFERCWQLAGVAATSGRAPGVDALSSGPEVRILKVVKYLSLSGTMFIWLFNFEALLTCM